ncbi:MAG: PQQ-binding-like beta-propeller repeat protein [Pseudonocardiales bacterium]
MSSGDDQPPYPPGQQPRPYPGPNQPGQYPSATYQPGQYPPAQGQPAQYPPPRYPAPVQPGQYPTGPNPPRQYPPPDEQPTAQHPISSPGNPYASGQQAAGGYGIPWQGQPAPQTSPYGSPYPYQTAPPKKSRTGWWIGGSVLAVVVIVAVLFVGTFALRANNNPVRGGRKPATGTGKILWRAPFTAGSVAGHPILAGVWVNDKTVIRGGGDGVHAYDINDGKEAWNLPIPSSGVVCSMAPTTLSGIGALIYGAPGKNNSACDHLLAVDTATGKQLWTADLTPVGGSTDTNGDPYTSVSLASNVVVIQTSQVMRAYRSTDGDKQWGLVLKPKDPTAIATCHPRNSLAQGDRALIVVGCSGSSGYVTALNAQTGATIWDHDLTTAEGDELFTDPLSVRPAVLQSHNAGGDPHLLVLDDGNGHTLRTIAPMVAGVELDLRSESSRLTGAFTYPVIIQDGKLYTNTKRDYGTSESKVVSIDLSTGQPAWTTGGGAKSNLEVISQQGNDVVAFDRGGYAHSPRFVRFDLTSGKRTDGLQLPKDLSTTSFGLLLYVQGNRLVVVAERPSASSPPILVAGKP